MEYPCDFILSHGDLNPKTQHDLMVIVRKEDSWRLTLSTTYQHKVSTRTLSLLISQPSHELLHNSVTAYPLIQFKALLNLCLSHIMNSPCHVSLQIVEVYQSCAGEGVPPEKVQDMFHSSRWTSPGGLGLSVCRKILKLMNGEVHYIK